jgi:PAS domain S-box-containing protein
MIASILLLDSEGKQLRHGAAPNLPDSYIKAIDGTAIGPKVGSCGTAAFLGKLVVVEDIAVDPLWADFRELGLSHGLRACWSAPILARDKIVLGTFALYYRQPRAPDDYELDLITTSSHLAAIAIESSRASEAIRTSERRFRAMVEDAFDGVSIIDPAGRILYVSPNAVRIMGQHQPSPGRFALQNLHPDDLPLGRQMLAQLVENPGSRLTEVMLRVRHTIGEYRWVELAACNRLDDPAVLGIVVNWRDVTQRVRAEAELRQIHRGLEERIHQRTAELTALNERLQQEVAERQLAEIAAREREAQIQLMVDSLPALIAFIDDQQRYRWVNRFYETWHRLPRDQFVGKHVREVIGDEEYTFARPYILRALSGESIHVHSRRMHAEGRSRHVDISLVPYLSENKVRGYFLLGLDMTDLKAAEDRVSHLQAELAHAGRLNTMGEMASGLAHELNQPLAAIATYASGARFRFAASAADGSELGDVLNRIIEQAERASAVIGRMRAFIARTPPRRAPESFDKIVAEALRLVENEIVAVGVRVDVELPAGLPAPWVDPIQIVQVLVNLLQNAVEAMLGNPSGTRRITIRAKRISQAVEVRVIDTGSGVLADIEPRLFQPFHTSKPEGMGMGLAICRSIIESHGGRIWAEANDGGGSVFSFTLPIARADSGVSDVANPESLLQ